MFATAPPAGAVLLLSAVPNASLSPFAPGKTATGSGVLTATDTSPSWTLQAEDQGTGAGKMLAATAGCSGSDPMLANPLALSVSSSLAGVSSAGQNSLGGTNQTIASATNQTLTADQLTVNYTQVIPPSEAMLTGCIYNLTVTYTLQ
jgi:hypothetical protein